MKKLFCFLFISLFLFSEAHAFKLNKLKDALKDATKQLDNKLNTTNSQNNFRHPTIHNKFTK